MNRAAGSIESIVNEVEAALVGEALLITERDVNFVVEWAFSVLA